MAFIFILQLFLSPSLPIPIRAALLPEEAEEMPQLCTVLWVSGYNKNVYCDNNVLNFI